MRKSCLRFARRWWAFILLCVAGAAQLILSEPFPQVAPTMLSFAAACGMVCLLSSAATIARREGPPRAAVLLEMVTAGALLLVGPAIALLFRPRDLVGSDLLLAGCLVPVVIAIASAAREAGDGLGAETLWPGLSAVGGLLLLVTQPRVHSLAGLLVLALLPVLTGVGATLLATSKEAASALRYATAAFGGFIIFATASLLLSIVGRFSWVAFVFAVVLIGATLASLVQIGARSYSSYFVILPLAALAYGYAIYRPPVTFRTGFGLMLLACAAVALLRGSEHERDEPTFIPSN